MKVKISSHPGAKAFAGHAVKVELGGIDISQHCGDIHVDCELDSIVTVDLRILPSETFEVDVDGMVNLLFEIPIGYELVQDEPVNGLKRTYLRKLT
jgi:hypothetical protein